MVTERLDELVHIDLSALREDPVARHRSVSRITLRQILLDGLDDVAHFDKKFARYAEAPDGRIVAHFDDGSATVGDVLVAADGGNSRVRAQFLPEAERVETGIVGIAGKVPLNDETRAWLPPKIRDGVTLVSAPKGRAMFCASLTHRKAGLPLGPIGGDDGASAVHSGLLFDNTADYLFWAFSTRREACPADLDRRDGAALQSVVLDMVAEWHPQFRQLVSAADPSTVMVVPIRTSVPVSLWPVRNITLIGDAIHSMTPYRGIGANVALRDAALLGRNLGEVHRGETSLLEAIRAYESEMIVYGFDAVRESRKAMEQAHAEGRVGKAITRVFFKTINAMPGVKRRVLLGSR
jgi:2-polyprenyl-6-methoxyphenol hydroxylase-like FAD-dependent oxidoreductase